MRNLNYCIIASLFAIISCTVNRDLSNARQNKIYTVSDQMYSLNLNRLSEIAEDSLILNDKYQAVAFLNEHKLRDTFDFEKRAITYRNIMEVLEVGKFKNQTGTKLVFQFWVDQKGDLVAAKYDDSSTAIIDDNNKSKILKAVMGYKAEPDKSGTLLMSGTLTIKLSDVNAVYN